MSFVTSPKHTAAAPAQQHEALGLSFWVKPRPDGGIEGEARLCYTAHLSEPVNLVMAALAEKLGVSYTPVKQLSAMPDPPEVAATKRENAHRGRVLASATRRGQRAGLDREEAFRQAAAAAEIRIGDAKAYVKMHRDRRDTWIKDRRARLLPRLERRGFTRVEIARRLNITPQYAGKLLAEYSQGSR